MSGITPTRKKKRNPHISYEFYTEIKVTEKFVSYCELKVVVWIYDKVLPSICYGGSPPYPCHSYTFSSGPQIDWSIFVVAIYTNISLVCSLLVKLDKRYPTITHVHM